MLVAATDFPSVQSETVPTAIVPPWIANPYDLVSWWDMERYSAHMFYQVARLLENLASLTTKTLENEFVPDTMLEGDSKGMKSAAAMCDSVGLTLSSMYAGQSSEVLTLGKQVTFRERSERIKVLQDRIQDEMSLLLVMRIPVRQAEFYDKPELFGKAVNAKFPGIQFDVVEAGNCYATGRSTAVVFHLMRIMEMGVQAFGTKLGVSLAGEKNWQNILEETDKAIRALPKSPQRIQMSQSSANLYAVKLAWRNEVMHPNDTYTLEEADNLIRQVKIFMEQLATIV